MKKDKGRLKFENLLVKRNLRKLDEVVQLSAVYMTERDRLSVESQICRTELIELSC